MVPLGSCAAQVATHVVAEISPHRSPQKLQLHKSLEGVAEPRSRPESSGPRKGGAKTPPINIGVRRGPGIEFYPVAFGSAVRWPPLRHDSIQTPFFVLLAWNGKGICAARPPLARPSGTDERSRSTRVQGSQFPVKHLGLRVGRLGFPVCPVQASMSERGLYLLETSVHARRAVPLHFFGEEGGSQRPPA